MCQAGNELEKLLHQIELPIVSASQAGHSGVQPGTLLPLVGRPSIQLQKDNPNGGPLLVESSINVQSIAALLAGVKEDDREEEEPMVCDVRQDTTSAVEPPSGEEDSCEVDTMNTAGDNSNMSVDEGKPQPVMGMSRGESYRRNAKDVGRLLDALVERLGSLKRKAEDSIQEELQAADNVRKRVQHLHSFMKDSEATIQTGDEDGLNAVQKAWKKSRLNRMLIDHLLREGMYDTARKLSEDLRIKELTNVDVSELAQTMHI